MWERWAADAGESARSGNERYHPLGWMGGHGHGNMRNKPTILIMWNYCLPHYYIAVGAQYAARLPLVLGATSNCPVYHWQIVWILKRTCIVFRALSLARSVSPLRFNFEPTEIAWEFIYSCFDLLCFAHKTPVYIVNPFRHFCVRRIENHKGFLWGSNTWNGAAQPIDFRSFTQRHAANQITAEKVSSIRKKNFLIKNCIFSFVCGTLKFFIAHRPGSRWIFRQWIFNIAATAAAVVIVTAHEDRFLGFPLFTLSSYTQHPYSAWNSNTHPLQ